MTIHQSVTSHNGDQQATASSHGRDKQSTNVIHVVHIDTNEMSKHIGYNHNFPCNICKGYHLTHMFPAIIEV